MSGPVSSSSPGEEESLEQVSADAPSSSPSSLEQKRARQSFTLLWCPSDALVRGGQLALVSTYLYGAAHGATDQLLPASFKALEQDLGLSPVRLGSASSCARIAHAAACPLWGLAVDCWGREKIFSSTAVGWGLSCILLSFVSEAWHLVPLLCCTGFFMAALGPLSQKVLSEEVLPGRRGAAFGTLQLFQSLSRMVSLMATTSISRYHLYGFCGWRYAFAGCGVLSVCLGLSLGAKLHERHASAPIDTTGGISQFSPQALQYIFASRSYWSMLLVGVVSGVPRSALNFSTMWLQYCGISDWWASFIVAASWAAAIVVAPFVGCAADYAAWHSPNHGRTFVGQLALLARATLMAIMLTCIPAEPFSFWKLTAFAVLIGLLAGWPGVGVNRPILSEITEPQHRATLFAVTSTCEGIGGALFGAPLVGYLSEHAFGYKSAARTAAIADLPHGVRTANARALGLAMLCMTVGPWMINVLLYCVLHATFKDDRRRDADDLVAKPLDPFTVAALLVGRPDAHRTGLLANAKDGSEGDDIFEAQRVDGAGRQPRLKVFV